MVWRVECSHHGLLLSNKKEWAVMGCGSWVECFLSMQKALCSIFGTASKNAMGLALQPMVIATYKDFMYNTTNKECQSEKIKLHNSLCVISSLLSISYMMFLK